MKEKRIAENLKIDLNFSEFQSHHTLCLLILCVFYTQFEEKVITFTDWQSKWKFFGIKTQSNTSTHNYDMCMTEH